jgi:hypothetical protein
MQLSLGQSSQNVGRDRKSDILSGVVQIVRLSTCAGQMTSVPVGASIACIRALANADFIPGEGDRIAAA